MWWLKYSTTHVANSPLTNFVPTLLYSKCLRLQLGLRQVVIILEFLKIFMERDSSIIVGSLDCESESHSVLLKFILFPFFKPVWLPLLLLHSFIFAPIIPTYQDVKLIFFSDSHLVPKFFKVVANSKKVGHHFQRQTKPFFSCQRFR